MDFNIADKKGQVLQVRIGGHVASVFASIKSHYLCARCACVRETDAGVAGARSPTGDDSNCLENRMASRPGSHC